MSSVDEMKKILSARLREVFNREPQELTARKLNTTQGNISKWIRGEQMPTSDRLYEIAKAYNVSIDWLLGLSPQKEIDGVVLEKLTYEQITRIIDYLLTHRNVEIPNLAKINAPETEYEEDENGNLVAIEPEPIFDSDYLKITDRALSYLVRRRYRVELAEMLDEWKENKLPSFIGLTLLDYNGTVEEAFDAHKWSGFKEGDWAELIAKLTGKTMEELQEIIEKEKTNGGQDNG